MTLYILRRLLWAVLVVNVVVFITFLVFFKLPNGDPALRFAGKSPTTAEPRDHQRQRLHLDKPFYVEYFYFVKNFFTGDEYGWPGLGYSYGNYVSVRSEMIDARAADALPHPRRRDHLARLRRRDRGDLRRQETHGRRPSGDGLRALRDQCARFLAGADGALHRLEEARAHERVGLHAD